MSFTNNPAGSAIDRVRLYTGDIDAAIEWLPDETYQYLLDKHNNSERKAAREAMQYILFSLARRTHEKAFQIEVWGDQMFANYEAALKLALKDPNLFEVSFIPYAGGISRTDMNKNVLNSDTPDAKLYRGMSSAGGQPAYLDKTLYSDPVNTWS